MIICHICRFSLTFLSSSQLTPKVFSSIFYWQFNQLLLYINTTSTPAFTVLNLSVSVLSTPPPPPPPPPSILFFHFKIKFSTSSTIFSSHKNYSECSLSSGNPLLTNRFVEFFTENIFKIGSTFPAFLTLQTHHPRLSPPMFSTFVTVTEDQGIKINMNSPSKSCSHDTLPTFCP